MKLPKLLFTLIALIALSFPPAPYADATTPAAAQASQESRASRLPAGIQAGPMIQGVSEYRLDNGLRVILAPDASRPQTTVNMTYLVGSRREGPGETGMAHLLEHLMFRGTEAQPDALAEFSRRGLAANGSTGLDATNYYATFASDPDTLRWFLSWQADAMRNARISRSDLDAEMTVVRNEMERGENSAFGTLLQQTVAAAYMWHPYGRSVIGARSDVEHVDIPRLRAFYDRYYQPDNAVLIVTGRFDPAQVLDWIAADFGPIARPERALPLEYTIEPVQQGARSITLRRPGGSPLILALYHIPAGPGPEAVALSIGADMLADSPSGPLYHALVDKGMASSVFGDARRLAQPGYVIFGAQIQPGADAQKALDTLVSTLEGQGIDALDQVALDRIRTAWLRQWKQTYNNSSALASALSDASAVGDWRLFFLERDQVEALSLEQVQTQLRAWLLPTNRTTGKYLPTPQPQDAPQPPSVNLDTLLAPLETGTPRPAVADFDTSPQAIDQATLRQTIELSNGTLHLALLPKPTPGDQVQVVLRLSFGAVEQFKGLGVIPALTSAMLERGTRGMDRQQIEDRLNALEAEIGIDGDDNTVRVGMRTTREHLPDLIALVLHLLREPTFPADELAKIQRSVATSTEFAMSDPASLAANALERHGQPWNPDDIRYTPTPQGTLAEVERTTRQDLVDFHTRFYGAGDLAVSAVGDFDPQALEAQLRAGLEGWRTAPAYTRIPRPWYPVKPETFHLPTPGKANANYLASLPLKLQDTDPRYPALTVANYLLGGSQDSRLWQRVRVRDGLSYSVGSTLEASSWEPSGSWTIFASMAPKNAKALESAVRETLHTTLRDGFTDEEVHTAVQSLLNFQQLGLSSDHSLALRWMHYLRTDRSFAWLMAFQDKLRALDAAQVNAALRAMLDPEGFSVAVAADPDPKP
uniref:M16 family metallopeptidase n=1 Tax=Castellaniella defragrans TaxID=75697 RepID=UPI00333F153D